jgi:hypothetical protein
MALNEEYLQRACEAFDAATGQPRNAVVAAIETYIAEMFKPDKGMILEPLEAIPQRDYRKELWIGVAVAVANGLNAVRNGIAFDRANEALAAFDKLFPKEHNHG